MEGSTFLPSQLRGNQLQTISLVEFGRLHKSFPHECRPIILAPLPTWIVNPFPPGLAQVYSISFATQGMRYQGLYYGLNALYQIAGAGTLGGGQEDRAENVHRQGATRPGRFDGNPSRGERWGGFGARFAAETVQLTGQTEHTRQFTGFTD